MYSTTGLLIIDEVGSLSESFGSRLVVTSSNLDLGGSTLGEIIAANFTEVERRAFALAEAREEQLFGPRRMISLPVPEPVHYAHTPMNRKARRAAQSRRRHGQK